MQSFVADRFKLVTMVIEYIVFFRLYEMGNSSEYFTFLKFSITLSRA